FPKLIFMKITTPKDCDNAPKKRIIKDFLVSIFQHHWQEVEQILEPNFKFISIGKDMIEDKEGLKKHFSEVPKMEELMVVDILTHGKFGACNGEIKLKNQIIHFAYFIEFKSAGKNTITKITEYRI